MNLLYDFRENKNYYKNKIEMVVIVMVNGINILFRFFNIFNVFFNLIKDFNCKKYLFFIGV